jgi:hypothetical protein
MSAESENRYTRRQVAYGLLGLGATVFGFTDGISTSRRIEEKSKKAHAKVQQDGIKPVDPKKLEEANDLLAHNPLLPYKNYTRVEQQAARNEAYRVSRDQKDYDDAVSQEKSNNGTNAEVKRAIFVDGTSIVGGGFRTILSAANIRESQRRVENERPQLLLSEPPTNK